MPTAIAAILARPIAHRGLHDRKRGRIENSIQAAEAAVAAGFGIECDIQVSADGEAIVFHDEDLARLTLEAGRVDARSAAALATIGLRDSGDRIATLPAFLARVAGRVPLVIEIKSGHGNAQLAHRAVELVSAYPGPVALKSFDPAIMAECRRLGAPCPLGLVGPADGDQAGLEGLDPYDFLSWHIGALAALGQRAPETPLMSWTVRSAADHATAARCGAQIVFERYDPLTMS